MSNLFNEFQSTSKEDWLNQINKELKGKSLEENLHYSDEIQQINYRAYYHKSDGKNINDVPGKAPYRRGSFLNNNDWSINCIVQGRKAKDQNSYALRELMRGADSLTFYLDSFSVSDISEIVREVNFEFIKSSFYCSSKEQVDAVLKIRNSIEASDMKLFGTTDNITQYILSKFDSFNNHCIEINAFSVHAAGGNISQEIAYALHEGHKQLFDLLEKGESIDNATPKLKFTFGIDSNYLLESVKGSVFRTLWSHVVSQYNPEHDCTKNAYVEMKTGFVNKSIQDPYTNLLRQTTEAMSAVISGCNELTIQPFDLKSEKQDFDFSQRMANNISLLLKEESYFHHVIDTTGGSYALENLAEELSKNSYILFQELENADDAQTLLRSKIEKTRSQRVAQFENGDKMLIGVNKYLNPVEVKNSWKPTSEEVFGEFIIERDCKLIEA